MREGALFPDIPRDPEAELRGLEERIRSEAQEAHTRGLADGIIRVLEDVPEVRAHAALQLVARHFRLRTVRVDRGRPA